jgi:uncharacterized protein
MEAIRLLVVLALIIIAVRRQYTVGVTLTVVGLLTALLYQIGPVDLVGVYKTVVTSRRFLSITAVIVMVTTLGEMLRRLGFLETLTDACRKLPGGNRTAVVALPMLIGLLPMPGGALLSAPLVDNIIASKHDGAFKTIANYWFRHMVEFCWPIYPGLILSAAITHLPIGTVALLQLPFTLAMAAVGGFFFLRKIAPDPNNDRDLLAAVGGVMSTLWPIAAAVLIYAITGIDMAMAVALSMLMLFLVMRPAKSVWWPAVKKGLSYRLLLMAFGILSFQAILETTGAIQSLPTIAASFHLPDALVIFIVCFTVGFLTGMIAAFVGLGYVLLAGFLYQPTIVPHNIMIAFFSGYLGMMVSPTHLCLVLSAEYFKSPLGTAYRVLALPLLALTVLAVSVILTPWPSWIVP